jgi:hypothetical protein
VETPANPPGAPTGLSAIAKSSGARLSWTAPASNGGSPISSYRITPYVGGNAQPATITGSAAPSAELGVKFSSDVAGTVSGVRFYKAAANTGTHVGSLWNAAGSLLAQANFSDETASGWQQVKFSNPRRGGRQPAVARAGQ